MRKNTNGFTILETLIVLAIVGLILGIVLVAIPEFQASSRDKERKDYAGRVFQAMEEYYKNNGHFLDPDNGADWARFMTEYMPAGKDPSTGQTYPMANVDDVDWVTGGQINPQKSVIIYWDGLDHNHVPDVGQINIDLGHVCQTSHPDKSGIVLSDEAYNTVKHRKDTFAIVIYQERGGFYCIDNWAGQAPVLP